MSRAPDDLARGYRQAQAIAAMLILTLGSYAYIVEMIRTQRAPFAGFVPTSPIGLLRPALAVMAVLGLVFAKTMRSNILAGRTGAGVAAPRVMPVVPQLLTASVVTLAMCEAIAIYGVVLFLLGGQRSDFYGFAAGAFLALAVYFPRRSLWEAWAHQA